MTRSEYIDSKTAAKMLDVSERAIRKWAATSKIPAYRFGKLWKFRPEELRVANANSYPRG